MRGEPYDAVVLAGGSATRLGGVDKPELRVGGRRLLDRVLEAVADAAVVVVVGPPRSGLPAGVRVVRERPAGGGPVAALAAALPSLTSATVAVLAGDLPFLTASDVARLRAALGGDGAADGAVLLDDEGRRQLLAGVWRLDPLRDAAVTVPPHGASMRRLVEALQVVGVPPAPRSAGLPPPPWWDCDTEDQLRSARQWAEAGTPAVRHPGPVDDRAGAHG